MDGVGEQPSRGIGNGSRELTGLGGRYLGGENGEQVVKDGTKG